MLAQHSELRQRCPNRKSTKNSSRDRGHHQHRERPHTQRRRQGITEKGDREWINEDKHHTSPARFREASSDFPSSAPLTRKKRRNKDGRKTRRQAGVPGGVSSSSSRETLRLVLGASIGVNMHDEKQPRMTSSELENFAERAPFLSISTYGRYLEAHNLLPIVAAFYDESTESHWQGCVCVLDVEDTTADTQAEGMLHTITNVLHYPPERILYVGSDTLAMGDDFENDPGYLFERKLSVLMEQGISETNAGGVPPIDG